MVLLFAAVVADHIDLTAYGRLPLIELHLGCSALCQVMCPVCCDHHSSATFIPTPSLPHPPPPRYPMVHCVTDVFVPRFRQCSVPQRCPAGRCRRPPGSRYRQPFPWPVHHHNPHVCLQGGGTLCNHPLSFPATDLFPPPHPHSHSHPHSHPPVSLVSTGMNTPPRPTSRWYWMQDFSSAWELAWSSYT